MYTFTKDSAIVQQQIFLIDEGILEYDDVLDLFNLREVIKEILDERKKSNEDN